MRIIFLGYFISIIKMEGKNKVDLALVVPRKQGYSQTFIQAHEDQLPRKIHFYYGSQLPGNLKDIGPLNLNPLVEAVIYILKKFGFIKNFNSGIYALKRSFRSRQIDVVLAEFGYTGVRVLPVCKQLKLPLVVCFFGADAYVTAKSEKYLLGYKNVFEYASYIIVVSSEMKGQLEKLGCNPKKLVYTPCGPADECYEVKPDYSSQNLFAMGRFVDKKAPYYSILAMERVLKKYPDAQLTIAGEGVLWNVCKNLVAHLNIRESVRFVGVVSQEDARQIMSKSRAFVQHSITAEDGDKEGTPVAILEASAAGLPVVSTRHAGIPEVVIENETGFLVDEHDVDGMAKKMMELLDNPNLALKMGQAGKKHVKENFSMARHIRTLNEIIEVAINE